MTPEERIADFRKDYLVLETEIARVLVGSEDIVRGVLVTLFAGGHALLEGVPGLGKTLLIRTLADALRLRFSRIQFTPDLMPADIIGTNVMTEDEQTGRRKFEFWSGPIFANIVLADEINRATPKTQSALLEAMQEKAVTSYGETRALEQPFFVMATQNPIEQEGTYPLPEAQLDRFSYKLWVNPPTRDELNEIVKRTTTGQFPQAKPVLDGPRIVAHQALVREIVIAPHIMDYATRLVLGTHPGTDWTSPMVEKYCRFGASPRAAQTLVLAGKVHALVEGRANVAFIDIADAALPALRHRLILNFEGEAEGVTTDDLVKDLVKHIPREAPVAQA